MTELDLVRLRELAAELGYWPAATDEEHVARLRAQDARYDEQESQDPGGTKWQKMMGAWVIQVKKSSVQERKDRRHNSARSSPVKPCFMPSSTSA
jgi:erythromycin esterase-like protein